MFLVVASQSMGHNKPRSIYSRGIPEEFRKCSTIILQANKSHSNNTFPRTMQMLKTLFFGAGVASALGVSTSVRSEIVEHQIVHPNGSTVSVFEYRPVQPLGAVDRRSVDWFDHSDAMSNLCGATTWESHPTGSSPLVSDCQAIAAYHKEATHMGYYTVRDFSDPATFQGLYYSGTCYFGIRPKTPEDAKAIPYWYIGSQDITDLIHDSIARFGKDGKVSAEGDMSCKNNQIGSAMGVHWGIYGY